MGLRYIRWMTRALRIGIDENGLGSRLGPLLVTGALVELRGDPSAVARDVKGIIDDSKALCAHGDMARVEALVLAVHERHLGERSGSYDALHRSVAHQSDEALRALCPRGESTRMCFASALELPAFGGLPTDSDRRAAGALIEAGMRVVAVRQAYACARSLNVQRALGRSRFDVDLGLMIEVAFALRAQAGESLDVVCGKVGGRKSYGAALTERLALVAPIGETQAESSYQVPAMGTVRFVRDADSTDPTVALASLYGKYARELAMARIHRYFKGSLPLLHSASGYHDPVSARYVEATATLRAARGIADDCFER